MRQALVRGGRFGVGHPAARVLAFALVASATVPAAMAGSADAAAATAAVQPGPSGSPLGPMPWDARALTGSLVGFQVMSDVDPARTTELVSRIVAVRAAVNQLFAAGDLPARDLPTESLLFFTDPEDARLTVRRRTGADLGDARALLVGSGSTQTLFAVVGPAGDDSMIEHAPLAAAAPELLAAAARSALRRPFQRDLPPALESGLAGLASGAVVLSSEVVIGQVRPDAFERAQIVVRDRSPDLGAILGTGALAWDALDEESRADASVVVETFLQFASGRERGSADARTWLQAIAVRVNAGDLPPEAIARATAAVGPVASRAVGGWNAWIRRATPDPLTAGVRAAEILASGLAHIVAEGRPVPADFEATALALADMGWSWTARRGGAPLTVTVSGPETFDLPEDPRRGVKPSIHVIPAGADVPADLVPGFRLPSPAERAGRPPLVVVRGIGGSNLIVRWSESGTARIVRAGR